MSKLSASKKVQKIKNTKSKFYRINDTDDDELSTYDLPDDVYVVPTKDTHDTKWCDYCQNEPKDKAFIIVIPNGDDDSEKIVCCELHMQRARKDMFSWCNLNSIFPIDSTFGDKCFGKHECNVIRSNGENQSGWRFIKHRIFTNGFQDIGFNIQKYSTEIFKGEIHIAMSNDSLRKNVSIHDLAKSNDVSVEQIMKFLEKSLDDHFKQEKLFVLQK